MKKISELEKFKKFAEGKINFICQTQRDYDILMQLCETIGKCWNGGWLATQSHAWSTHRERTIITLAPSKGQALTYHELGGNYDVNVNRLPNIVFKGESFIFIDAETFKEIISCLY